MTGTTPTPCTGVSGPRPHDASNAAASRADAARQGANGERRGRTNFILLALAVGDRVPIAGRHGVPENEFHAAGVCRTGPPVLVVVGVVLEGRAWLVRALLHGVLRRRRSMDDLLAGR